MQENNDNESIEKEINGQLKDDFERIIKEFFGLSLISNPAFTINAQVFTNKIKKSECDCSTCQKRKKDIEFLENCYKMEYKENA